MDQYINIHVVFSSNCVEVECCDGLQTTAYLFDQWPEIIEPRNEWLRLLFQNYKPIAIDRPGVSVNSLLSKAINI